MRCTFSSISLWSFLALAALLALQAFPYTGIFLMLLGAPLLAGLLVHLFLLSLAFEAAFRRVPRILMIVPIAAYGAYYVVYAYQGALIGWKSVELRAANPGKLLDFDPQSYSLVASDASNLTQRYAVPVVYEANVNTKPEGYLAHRVIRRDQCQIRKDSQARIQIFGMHFDHTFIQQVCVLRVPEAPPHKLVTVVKHGDEKIWKRKWDISESTTQIVVDGAVLGTYRSASVWRLPAIPAMAIGCGLVSSTPAWKCGAEFMRSHTVIDAVPDRVDRTRFDTPASVMLGLRKYSLSDLTNFHGYEQNDVALARVAGEPDRVENDVFEALGPILDGQNPKPPFNMGYSLAQNPQRLAPFADRMATRFVELSSSNPRQTPNHEDQIRALATALVSLPRASFVTVAPQLFEVTRRDRAWDRHPALYLRIADAGPQTLELYKRDFLTGTIKTYLRMLPVLAICRIGQADDEVIAEMKRQLVSSEPNATHDEDYKSALIVALIKLGQESYVRENAATMSPLRRDWVAAVLQGKGLTDTGPNNCMGQRWGSTDYLGPAMAPTLQLQRGVWSERVPTN